MSYATTLRGALLAGLAAPLGCGGQTGDGASANGGSGPSLGAGGSSVGTGGASSGAGGGTGQGGASGVRFPCVDPTPITNPDGSDSGYDLCEDNVRRRRASVTCASQLPRAAACVNPPGLVASCSTDADCAEMPYGFCSTGESGGPAEIIRPCACSYGCETDADCGTGAICACGSPVGMCEMEACQTDADCGAGSCLAWSDGPEGCGSSGFACQSEMDQCAADADCPPSGGQGDPPRCLYESGFRQCVEMPPQGCPAGRPLHVAGRPRLAALAHRAGWSEGGLRRPT